MVTILDVEENISQDDSSAREKIDIAKVDKVAFSVAQTISEESEKPLKSFTGMEANQADESMRQHIQESRIVLNSREVEEAVRRIRGRLLETEIDWIALVKWPGNDPKPSSVPADIREWLRMNY